MKSTHATSKLSKLKLLGDKALEQQDFPKALDLYQKALAINPENAELYKCLGRVYHDQNLYEQAEEYYQKSIEKDPSYWAPYHNLGNIYKGRQQYKEAMAFYQQTIQLDPGNPFPYLGLGMVYCSLNQHKKAQQAYNQANLLAPNEFKVQYNQAHSFIQNEKFARAAFQLEQLLRITPEKHQIDVYCCLAKAYTSLPQYTEKALETWHRFISVATLSNQNYAYQNMAWIYERDGQYEQALQCCRLAADHQESHTNELVWLNEFTNRFQYFRACSPVYDLGIKYLLEYKLAHPNSKLAHHFLAESYNMKGQYLKATQHAEASIAINPNHPRSYFHLALGYYYLSFEGGNYLSECIVVLKKMMTLDPLDYYESYEKLADIYRRQGKEHLAIPLEKKGALLLKYRKTMRVKAHDAYFGEHC